MKRIALVAALVFGCAGDDSCVFDGRYEVGAISRTPGCTSRSISIHLSRLEEECVSPVDTWTPTLVDIQGLVSCEPGDPVVECEGFVSDSDGCFFDVYFRRTGG